MMKIIKISKNKFLLAITNAYRHVANEDVHQYLAIETISEIITEFPWRCTNMLTRGSTAAQDIRRFNRVKPYEIVTQAIV